mmetsp:Transcript_44189/g.104610  ORF Transcript_44189/g.104610 Transcript_44189/m.104610 type:complete len:487 (+) Transcript_44189:72-1532(+)
MATQGSGCSLLRQGPCASRMLMAMLLLAGSALPRAVCAGELWTALPDLRSTPREKFRSKLQRLLDEVTEASRLGEAALQLSWKSVDFEVTVSSGEAKGRDVTAKDTWLFGSATKPYTAVMVMQAMERGLIDLNETVSHYVDPMLLSLVNTTMVDLFGPRALNVTVWHLVTMQSGLPDFDVPALDEEMLTTAFNESWAPIRVIEAAAKEDWVCDPGECVYYSSTNFVLLGFVLLAANGPAPGGSPLDWSSLDQSSVLPLSCENSGFVTNSSIRSKLTVPGISDGGVGLGGEHERSRLDPSSYPLSASRAASKRNSVKPTRIYAQPADILGWTCGNVVATTLDVARFMWDLLATKTLVNESTLALMTQTRPMSFGFGKGLIEYGAGLFSQQSDYAAIRKSRHWNYGDWGTTLGHGGDTYGFISDQGFIPQFNATWSYVVNRDMPPNRVYMLTCEVIRAAAEILYNKSTTLLCGRFSRSSEPPADIVMV